MVHFYSFGQGITLVSLWTDMPKARVRLETQRFRGSEVGGAKWSGAEAPTGNPSPAPSASAPHARHDRSMARSSSEARAICGLFSCSPPVSRKYVPSPWRVPNLISVHFSKVLQWFRRVHGEYMESTWRVHGSFLLILIRNYNGFLVDMDFCRSRESSFEQGITMVS